MNNYIYEIFIILLILCSNFINTSDNIHKNIDLTNIENTKVMSNKRNLILGVIVKFSWIKIAPFFKSLIRANYQNCDIIMFVNWVSPIVIKYLESFGIIVYKIPNEYKDKKIDRFRWKLYTSFLKEKKDKYNLVMSLDIRDTIIQDNIFKFYENHKPFLGFSIEDLNLNQKDNKEWIVNSFGIELHKTIMMERIICAGTIWGTANIFFEFANKLLETLLAYPKATDQCIVNYLIYHEHYLKDFLVRSDDYGLVMTIGFTLRENIILDSQKNILNFNGQIAPIVHQYDRFPDILKIIVNKYSPESINAKIKSNTLIIFILLECFTIALLFKSIIAFYSVKKCSKPSILTNKINYYQI